MPDLEPIRPPEFPLVDVSIDPAYASVSQFLGLLEESERKRAIKRSYSMWITRDLDTAIDRIAHDSRCGYEHNVGTFVLHAIWLLANAYKELGYPDVALGAELLHEQRVRADADRARRRNNYVESIHQYDDELDLAQRTGDWESIDAHLAIIESYLQSAPTPAARTRVLNATVQSFSLQQAVLMLDDLCRRRKLGKETTERARRWRLHLEEIGLDKHHPGLVT